MSHYLLALFSCLLFPSYMPQEAHRCFSYRISAQFFYCCLSFLSIDSQQSLSPFFSSLLLTFCLYLSLSCIFSLTCILTVGKLQRTHGMFLSHHFQDHVSRAPELRSLGWSCCWVCCVSLDCLSQFSDNWIHSNKALK